MRTTKATSQQQMQQQQMNHQQIMTGKGTTATTWMEALPPKAATMEYRTKVRKCQLNINLQIYSQNRKMSGKLLNNN